MKKAKRLRAGGWSPASSCFTCTTVIPMKSNPMKGDVTFNQEKNKQKMKLIEKDRRELEDKFDPYLHGHRSRYYIC